MTKVGQVYDLPYAELHARSAFSFLEGASIPEALISQCADLKIPAIALLDRDNLSGAVRLHQAAKKAGIRALVGAEVTAKEGFRYPLLVETREGYQNLCRLLSKIKLREANGNQHQAAATLEDLAEYSRGLICLTGGDEGPLAFSQRQVGDLPHIMEQIIGVFGKNNVYVELQRHHLREKERRNQAAMNLAARFHLPVIATNGVCHATPEERELMDVLTCVRHKTTIDKAGRLLAKNSESHLKPAHEMAALFADIPEAIAETRELAARLSYTLADLGYQFPPYPVPPGETMDSLLRKLTEEGARGRYGATWNKASGDGKVRKQIERELALIEKLKLPGYFLIVWDIVKFCRDRNILVQGRGSAANSAVCYSLGITAIDPIGMDLLFERFLSENRGEWPDIDLDLPSGDQRERAIQYVYERYGRLGAAMTANVISYRGRSAARDVGKVLGFEEEMLARLSSLAPRWGYHDPKDSAQRQFHDSGIDLRQPLVQKFLSLYCAIQDLPRHLGQHSGGMVICQGRLDAVVPLQPATMPGRVVVQWDKEDCADMGIIKVDLLGLGMMAVLEDSIALIREHSHEEVDLAHLPQEDAAVYAALQKADTVGLFQVESRAQMSCLPRLKPKTFYDIVVEVAIIRPGPIVGEMYHPYLRRRQGREAPESLHPSLEPVLKRTLGVPLFQEQLLKMAMITAGFSGSEAEELRRAFGFKRSEKRMQEIEGRLRAGMTNNGITGEVQDRIVKSISSFALYGFPESHAASFALIAYASAYLKCHYLAAFTAAILNNQPMGFYSPQTLVKDAQRHGLHFKPVDVTRSQWLCTIEHHENKQWVRLGFNYIKGFREDTARAIAAERERAPFGSIRDLVRRVPGLHRDALTRLAEIGALNSLGGAGLRPANGSNAIDRREALWQSELALRPVSELLDPICGADERDQGARGQGVARGSEDPPHREDPSPLAPMDAVERLHADFHNSGLTIGPHPMSFQRERMNRMGVIPAGEIHLIRDGVLVRIAGCVIVRQRPGTAKGFLFLTLEDETGISNAIVRPDLFDAERTTLVSAPYLIVEGMLQNQDGVVAVKAERVRPLNTSMAPAASHDFR
jgi:error-prone DNA polymerase